MVLFTPSLPVVQFQLNLSFEPSEFLKTIFLRTDFENKLNNLIQEC